jgi:hypothetical protein
MKNWRLGWIAVVGAAGIPGSQLMLKNLSLLMQRDVQTMVLLVHWVLLTHCSTI